MFGKRLIVTILVILGMIFSAPPAHAMGMMMRFDIFVDGKKVLRGEIDHSFEMPKHEAVEYLGNKLVYLSEGSPLSLVPQQGIDLKGKIDFAFRDYPPMQLDSLRIVYTETEQEHEGKHYVTPKWQIHSEDAAKIVAYYQPILRRDAEQAELKQARLALWSKWSPLGIGSTTIVLSALVAFFLARWLYQRRRAFSSTQTAL